jgi:predicted dehydrogenase
MTAPRVLRTGLLGAGSFADYHAGKLASLPQSAFQGLFDPDLLRAQALADKHSCRPASSLPDLLRGLDAIIIASPANTHFDAARSALEEGLHVYVEKPLAEWAPDADMLVAEASRRGLVLQVGHQERLVAGALGLFGAPERPTHVEAVREGPGSGRGEDVSVTLDLLIHDLDLAIELIGADPVEAAASSDGEALNVVQADVKFSNGATAHFRSSRRAKARARTSKFVYPSGAVDIDFVARTMSNRTGFNLDPDFASKIPDPLGAGVASFLKACLGEGPNIAPGAAAAKAVRLANMIDAAARSPD